MPHELDWSDTLEIGIQLQEMFPDTDPYSVRFTDQVGHPASRVQRRPDQIHRRHPRGYPEGLARRVRRRERRLASQTSPAFQLARS
jgi:hypothetical protein